MLKGYLWRRALSSALLIAASGCGGGGGGGGTTSTPVTPTLQVPTTAIPMFVTVHARFVGTPTGTAIADLDGDGHDDLVVITTDFFATGPGSDAVYVFYQRSNGLTDVKFTGTSGTPVNADWTWSVAACDVDGDGKKELLIGYEGSSSLEIYKFMTDGTPFLSSTVTGVRASKIVCADLDGDGLTDVVTTGSPTSNVQVLLQRGGQLIEQGSYPSNALILQSATFDVGDIDGDGKPDIIFFGSSVTTNMVTLNAYLQTAPGQFGSPVTLNFPRDSNGAIRANDLAFGQLQTNTRNLAVSLGGNAPSASLVVTSHSMNGQTVSSTSLGTADVPTAIRVRDINGDGRPDIVVFHSGFGEVGLYYQNSDGSFTNEQLLSTFIADQNLGLNIIAFGDLNSDGKLDIAVADQTAIFVYIQQ